MTGLLRHFMIAVATAQVVAFVGYLVAAAYVIPFWDTLDWINGLYASETVTSWLWLQHADVRQPVVKLLLWLDLRWFGGAFYPIAAVSFLGLFLCMIGIARFTRAHMTSSTGRALALGIPFILCFQTFTLPSYMETSLVQHVLVAVFMIGAIWPLLHRDGQVPTTRRYGVAAIGALLATLTFPNGLLSWPIVAWLAWRRGSRWAWPLLYLAGGIAVAMIYFDGYRWDTHPSTIFDFDRAATILRFVIEFFSVPWIRLPVLYPLGLAIGAAILVFGAIRILGLARRRHDPTAELACVLLVFAVGTATMVAFARADMLDLRIQGTRYGIYAALAQLSAALLILPTVERMAVESGWRAHGLAIVGLLVTLGLAAQQAVIGNKAAAAGETMLALRETIRAGDTTPHDLAKLYPDPLRGSHHVALLKREGLYGFDE